MSSQDFLTTSEDNSNIRHLQFTSSVRQTDKIGFSLTVTSNQVMCSKFKLFVNNLRNTMFIIRLVLYILITVLLTPGNLQTQKNNNKELCIILNNSYSDNSYGEKRRHK